MGHLADVLPHVPDLVLLVLLGLPGLLGHVGAAVELDLEVERRVLAAGPGAGEQAGGDRETTVSEAITPEMDCRYWRLERINGLISH